MGRKSKKRGQDAAGLAAISSSDVEFKQKRAKYHGEAVLQPSDALKQYCSRMKLGNCCFRENKALETETAICVTVALAGTDYGFATGETRAEAAEKAALLALKSLDPIGKSVGATVRPDRMFSEDEATQMIKKLQSDIQSAVQEPLPSGEQPDAQAAPPPLPPGPPPPLAVPPGYGYGGPQAAALHPPPHQQPPHYGYGGPPMPMPPPHHHPPIPQYNSFLTQQQYGYGQGPPPPRPPPPPQGFYHHHPQQGLSQPPPVPHLHSSLQQAPGALLHALPPPPAAAAAAPLPLGAPHIGGGGALPPPGAPAIAVHSSNTLLPAQLTNATAAPYQVHGNGSTAAAAAPAAAAADKKKADLPLQWEDEMESMEERRASLSRYATSPAK
jgi:hypothetical protein